MVKFRTVGGDEEYLIGVMDLAKPDAYYILVPNRKKLGELFRLLPEERYYIAEIKPLGKTKSYAEMMKELTEDSKPEGLNFGKE